MYIASRRKERCTAQASPLYPVRLCSNPNPAYWAAYGLNRATEQRTPSTGEAEHNIDDLESQTNFPDADFAYTMAFWTELFALSTVQPVESRNVSLFRCTLRRRF